MVEATPSPPYELSLDSLMEVEESMVSRRFKLQSVLPPNVFVTSMTCFPRLGAEDFWIMDDLTKAADHRLDQPFGQSIFIPRKMVNPHPRFGTLSNHLAKRRGHTMTGLLPVYKDHNTESHSMWDESKPLSEIDRKEISLRSQQTQNPVQDYIYFDNIGNGMGQCCLQMTYGTRNVAEARKLYDAFAVLAPIFLSLSAATSMVRGLLSDYDTRWRVLEQSVDCRSQDEENLYDRSRYGAVSMYIDNGSEYLTRYREELNDTRIPRDPIAYNTLIQEGEFDELLAEHFASLWVRDPIVVFKERIELDHTKNTDHFENIQSTNWNSVRFKPPPASLDGVSPSDIGWRVELRTPELQLSDFENAALCALSTVLTMAICKEDWNLYIPISQTLENMQTAHKRGSITNKRFWFRSQIVAPAENPEEISSPKESSHLMSLREIFLGSERLQFAGLLTMLDQFVSDQWRHTLCTPEAVEKYRLYSNLIRQRVTGQAWTNAKIMRHLATSHVDYQGDSLVTQSMNFEINKFAVLGGFGLMPQLSPWGIPGVLPSSFRFSSTQNIGKLRNCKIIQELVCLATDGQERAPDSLLGCCKPPPCPNCGQSHPQNLSSSALSSSEDEEDGGSISHRRCSESYSSAVLPSPFANFATPDSLPTGFDACSFLQVSDRGGRVSNLRLQFDSHSA